MSDTNVNIIRIYDDPINVHLRKMWQDLADGETWRLHWFDNSAMLLSHGDALQQIWTAERERPERYAVFTEADVIPGPGFPGRYLLQSHPIIAVEYCTRSPETFVLNYHGIPGAWYILIDKELAPKDLDFTVGGPFNDPAVKLPAQLIRPTDCFPEHYGAAIADVGEHLFWSRYYGDDQNKIVPEFELDEDRFWSRYYGDDQNNVGAGFWLGDILRRICRRIKLCCPLPQ